MTETANFCGEKESVLPPPQGNKCLESAIEVNARSPYTCWFMYFASLTGDKTFFLFKILLVSFS